MSSESWDETGLREAPGKMNPPSLSPGPAGTRPDARRRGSQRRLGLQKARLATGVDFSFKDKSLG